MADREREVELTGQDALSFATVDYGVIGTDWMLAG